MNSNENAMCFLISVNVFLQKHTIKLHAPVAE